MVAMASRTGFNRDTTERQKLIEMLRFTPGKSDDLPSIDDILTPPTKGDHFVTTDTPLTTGEADMEMDLDGSYSMLSRRPLGKFLSFDVKRSLFSAAKRRLDDHDEIESPVTKKLREAESAFGTFSLETPESTDSIDDDVKTAVHRLATDDNLVADGTRPCSLPTIAGKHQDLKSISVDTMSDVLNGNYDDQIDHVTVIDCRYPYEYQGGHIKNALNLYTHEAVLSFLHQHSTNSSSKRHVLIFHCEFSSKRGPKMYRFLRAQDRTLNKEQYPALYFPEVYLLDGGYKAFYYASKNLCSPSTYMPMDHKDYQAELRHFRGKSKSWTAGERSQVSRYSLRF